MKLETAILLSIGLGGLLLARKAGATSIPIPKPTSKGPFPSGIDFWRQPIIDAAKRHNIDPYLMLATVKVESNFRPTASNMVGGDLQRGGAYGLVQMTLLTARGLGYDGEPNGLLDPVVNLDLGARLHAENLKRAKGNLEDAISLYNSGKKYVLAPATTRSYVQKVLAAMAEFRQQDALFV